MRVLGRARLVFGAIAAMFVMLSMGLSVTAHAEGEVPELRIQASPATLDFGSMKPGTTHEKVFKVQNTGSKVLKYELSVSPYNVSGEEYQQSFSTETQYNEITKWISFSQDSGEVEPGKQDEITVTIKVPNDVPAVGQYAAIMARIVNDKEASDGSAISALSQVGVIVYSSVDGNTRIDGSVVENKVPSFMFAPPITASSVVENTGNIHGEATYVLQVYSLFGNDEVYTNEESPETRIIMPETRRLNTLSWDGAPQLGVFRVKQTVKFLDQESVTEKIVFICPLWFLFVILVIIFLAIFWIVSRARGRKED